VQQRKAGAGRSSIGGRQVNRRQAGAIHAQLVVETQPVAEQNQAGRQKAETGEAAAGGRQCSGRQAAVAGGRQAVQVWQKGGSIPCGRQQVHPVAAGSSAGR